MIHPFPDTPCGMSIPSVIFVRVSTSRQETDRQEHELRAVAEQKGWTVIEVCREKVSGRADAKDRQGLTRVMELVAAKKVKKVLVHEISRLARRPSVLHTAVEEMEKAEVSLYWHSQASETLLPTGKRNPAAAMMLALMGEMARAETDTLRERIKSGLDNAVRKGVKLGRPKGGQSAEAFLAAHKAAVAAVKKNPNHSIREQARLGQTSTGTIQRIRKALAA